MPIDPAVDGGQWHAVKKAKLQSTTTSHHAPLLPITCWRAFPNSGIPNVFNYGHIYHYIVESVQGVEQDDSDCDDSTLDCHTAKPLRRGKQFYDSGNVTEMKDNKSDHYYHVKAKVLASMRQVKYCVTVTLSANSGFVQDASCECRSSALARCSHVAALLYAIGNCDRNADNLPCTSKPQTWDMGKKKSKNPKKITEAQYNNKRNVSSRIEFDPRPNSMRTTSVSDKDVNNFMIGMQQANQHSGQTTSMWESICPLVYEDYALTLLEQDLLEQKVRLLMDNLTPEVSGPHEVTSDQGTNTWMMERRLRVTASKAKPIFVATCDNSRARLVKSQLWQDPPRTSGMAYGHKYEQAAREEFEAKFQGKLGVTETGLWVNSKFPGLGASPDGIVSDIASGSSGVLEIKCPVSIKKVEPKNFSKALNRKQSSAFCLAMDGNSHCTLKRSHMYYYQMQMQMGVLEKKWGYFVVWTPTGLHCEKVEFDESLFNNMLPVLTNFLTNCLAPEYFEMRIPRNLSIIKLSM